MASDDINALAPLAPEGASPLEEADPNSINEFIKERVDIIFNKKPQDITEDDLLVTVEYFQRERARHLVESQNKPAKAPRARSGGTPRSVKDAMASYDDLL